MVRVQVAGLNPLDWKLMPGRPWPLRLALRLSKPKRAGVDVAGVVEAVGLGVTEFSRGDAVFGGGKVALAEYACACALSLARISENMSFEDAAATPVAAWTALQGLRDKGQLRAGRKMLINGASGRMGTFAMQIAKHVGAEVTGAWSTGNAGLVRALGILDGAGKVQLTCSFLRFAFLVPHLRKPVDQLTQGGDQAGRIGAESEVDFV